MTPWRLLLPEPVEGWLRTAVLALGVIYLPSPLPAVAQTGPEGPTPIFSDDFENGNYFNWSGAQFGAADVEDPEIFLLEPARPAVYNEDRPLIEVGYFDLDAGIEPASFRLTLDGTDLLAACTVAPDTASCPSGPLAVGMHEVRASVWDLAGNRSVGVWSFEVAVDTVAPTLGIRFWDGRGPGQDVIYNDETPVFNLLFEDDLAGVNPTSVTVTVDGSLTVNCSASSDSAFCETPVLAAGSHQIQASIEDYGGNPASAVFDFELFFDDQPPTVSVSLLPAAPRTGEDLAITLSYGDVGLGVDLATVHLEVNGMDRTSLCAVGPTTASCTVTAGNVGGHVLTGHVEDIAGNEARDLLRYRVAAADDAPPVVTLLTPAVGEILTTPDPVLRFSIADDDSSVDPSSVQALLDGLDLTAACSEAAGAFSCPVTGLGRGLHNLQVSASDLAGNAGSAAFSLAVQLSVAVSITQPVEGTLVAGGGAVDVAGTVAAGATSVTVNGFAATLAGGTFSLVGLPLHEGTNVLSAVAMDGAGNLGYDTVEVLVDGTQPRLSVDFPPQGSVHFDPAMTVSGMVHDPGLGTTTGEQVSVTVNGRPASVEHRSFRAENVPLLVGSNVLTVEAIDLAGNSRVEVLEVFYEPVPAAGRLVKVSGDLQSAPILSPLALPLVVQLLDAEGNPRAGETVAFEVFRGNGRFSGGERRLLATTDGAGQAAVSWVLGSRAGSGVQRVEATVAGVGFVSFAATAEAGAPERIHIVSGDGQQGVPGQLLSRPLQVIVTDEGQNPVAGVEVTFEVTAGGGTLGGGASQLVTTDARGYAAANLTVGSALGIGTHLAEASFAGQGQLPVLFQASVFLEGDPASTSLSGVVLDNAGVPVPGYTLSFLGSPLEVTSGPAGAFSLTGAPVGHQFLLADGTTASRPGSWPSLEFEVFLLGGIENRMSRPIFVLPLDVAGGVTAGGAEEAVVEIPEVPGFSLRVAPGSATFPDGLATGVVSATAVHADKIPMAPPEGMQPRFIVTVQPAGATFDPPAPVTFPNVDGLAPGSVTEMFSFDHDLGAFVSIGTGTVSSDGTVIASDPGFGITKAGWHCAAPQSGRGQSGGLRVEYLGPNPLVLLAGTTSLLQEEVVEAAGTPARSGEYHWNVENSGIAEITAGTCPGQPLCPATVTSGSPGQTTGSIRFLCVATQEHVDQDFDIVVASLRLAEVSFSGDSYQEVLDDAGGRYEPPHWKDNSQPPDGDASDPPTDDGFEGDRRFPVSFKRNTRMKVSARFAIEPAAPSINSLHIRGVGPAGINFPATEATVSGDTAEVMDVEMEEALANAVAFHNPLVIDWEASVDGGRTWNQVGRSENRVYVTLSEPALNSVDPPFSYEVFETALEVGSRNAIGARTTREVIDGVWEDFKGPLPGVLRKTMNGLNEPDGLEMKYWLDNADPETSPAFGCQSVGEMLTPEPEQDILAGVGTCRAWSQFMLVVLGSQGIDTGTLMRVFPEPDVFPDLGRVGILVKNWEFNGDGNSTGVCPGFTHVNGVDLNDLEGLPGQGVGNPPAFFNQHFIVLVGGRYYDPSYGSGPFGGTSHHQAWEAWEDVSIDGFYKRCGGRTRVGRAQAPGVREIAMADEDAEDEPEEPAP